MDYNIHISRIVRRFCLDLIHSLYLYMMFESKSRVHYKIIDLNSLHARVINVRRVINVPIIP